MTEQNKPINLTQMFPRQHQAWQRMHRFLREFKSSLRAPNDNNKKTKIIVDTHTHYKMLMQFYWSKNTHFKQIQIQ